MQRVIILALAGVLGLSGPALAQDPSNAFIPDIQNGVFPEGTFVTMQEVVVTAVAPFGVWVQEPAATSFERSGMWCYTSSAPQAARGDLIDISGEYVEYFGVSEVDVTLGGQIINRGLEQVPDPPVREITEVTTGSATAEEWESVLIQVEDVEVIRHLDFGEYTIMPIGGTGFDTLRVDDRTLNTPARPPVGAQFNSMTGVLDYTFDDFKLQPRDSDDFDWLAGEPAPALEIAYCTSNTDVVVVFDRNVDQATAEDPLNYFFNNLGEFANTAAMTGPDEVALTVITPFTPGSTVPEILEVSGVENTSGTPMGTESTTFIGGVNTIDFVQTIGSGLDSSQVAGEVVTVEGIVTGDNSYDYIPPDGNRYYIEMPGGGPLSGIFVFDRFTPVERGDEVRVAGVVAERFFKTEFDDPPYVEVLSTGNAVPGPDVVAMTTLSDPAMAEPWEGVLVRVENVEVAQDTSFGFGEWTIKAQASTDTVVVGDEGLYFYDPQVGDQLGYVQGPLDYSFSDFKIQARRWDDIDSPNGIAVDDARAPAAKTALLGSAPNPFNPSTSIQFELRGRSPVVVEIYDGTGRKVRTLLAGKVFDAGQHAIAWDGRDDQGRILASGVYHYRFQADGVEASRKLTLVK